MYGAPPVMQQGKVGFLLYSGIDLRSLIEAPIITREVLTETYLLLVWQLMLKQDHFLQFQASCLCGTL